MYCRNCGNKVDENAYICVNCGVILKNDNNNNQNIKKKKNSNTTGIISIIFGVLAFISSFSSFLIDISDVGMYTEVYERIFFAFAFTFVSIILTILSLVFALIKKNKTCNKVGLGLALISAFLIITEFMVIIIY